MTISSSTSRVSYAGNGSTTAFTVPFYFLDNTHLKVVKRSSTGTETTLVLNTDYTVTGATVPAGGSVTTTVAPASGETLTISRNVPLTQETDYIENDPFPAASHERALDKLTMIVQQQNDSVARSLIFPTSDPNTVNGTLPTSLQRAGQFLSFDALGNPQTNTSIPSFLYQGANATDPTIRFDGSALQAGDLYFNTATSRMRAYTGSLWVDAGTPIPLTVTAQTFNGTGSQTVFTLSSAPAFPAALDVSIAGVTQKLNIDFTVGGTTLTFVTAPPSGTSNIYVKILSAYAGGVPNDGSVTPAKMANSGAELGMRNRIINGAMMIDQRNAGASVTPADANYTLDRWTFALSQASKLTCQQNAGSVTPPAGFNNYLGITSSSAYTVGASEWFTLIQNIEGFNTADLNWGTANAATVTLSFKVYSSLIGTFGGALSNSAATRSYPFTYIISSANTWTSISVTIPGDTTGTWVGATNGLGIRVWFNLGAGSSVSGAAGAWAGALYRAPTGATSVVGTNGATFYITGVQLEKGSTATSFDYRPYGTELALCQRYYQTGVSYWEGYNTINAPIGQKSQYIVSMRAAPSLTYGTLVASNCSRPTTRSATVDSFGRYVLADATGSMYATEPWYATAEL